MFDGNLIGYVAGAARHGNSLRHNRRFFGFVFDWPF
jgi:hypothetical protein